MSGIDIASNSALLSVADKLDTQNIFLAAIAGKDGGLPIKDWATVQSLVRAGLAPKVFAIGDQLVCNHETYGELVWDIIGIDHDTPSDSQFTHSMTLQLHDCCTDFQFDAQEALYYCTEELPAGTYYFTIQNYDAEHGGNASYYFTLSNAVPEGGQIDFRWGQNMNAPSCKISTYASAISTEIIETVNVTEGTEGTFLGISDGSCENMNHIHRARYGSNRWSQSAIKRWLNTDAEGSAWWSPSNIFDRPSSGADKAGFLNGIDTDFLSVIGKVNKRTALNTITDGGGYEESDELLFLISRSEVYSTLENKVNEGEPYPYYQNYSDLTSPGATEDSNRIRFADKTVKRWWLRSPLSGNGSYAGLVNEKGTVGSNNVYLANGVSPACCIV